MDQIYQDPKSSASSEALLESRDQDDPRSSDIRLRGPPTGHETPRRLRVRAILNISANLALYLLALCGLLSVGYNVVHLAQQSHSSLFNNHKATLHKDFPIQALNDSSHEFEPRCLCGNSTAQAKARGCKLDMLSAAWLPPHCIDDELSAEFDRSGPGLNGEWTYYNGSSADDYTVEISVEAIELGSDDPDARFYANWDWHMLHCMFYWKKMWRASLTGTTLEGRYDNEGHINHCTNALLAERGWDTMFGIRFNT